MSDDFFMSLAYKEACKAFREQEVPVGAIIVKDQQILSQAYNKKEQNNSPLAHAEVLAIQEATQKLGDWRLLDCDIYVTLEPCLMCTSLILASRLKRIIYGCQDEIFGVIHSHFDQLKKLSSHYQGIEIISGVNEEACSDLLKKFFKNQRQENKK